MSTVRNDLDIYNRRASEWWNTDGAFSPLFHFNTPRFEYFDRFVRDWRGLEVLDLGCGGGFASEFMAKRGAEVSGVDLSDTLLGEARKHAESSGLTISYKQGKAEEIPFEANRFDALVCVDVLEHVADLNRVLGEIHRVLKPGGYFLFDTINRTFKSRLVMIWWLENIARVIPKGVHDWSKFIKPQELTSWIINAGFSDIDVKGFDIRGKDRQTGAPRVLINNNMAVMYIGKARKL